MPNSSYRISATSGLNVYRDCPKCFWLLYNKKISRPRGIFPSLPGGMDEVIKKYFDTYRQTAAGLPPELAGQIEARLFADQALLDRWRNWRSGLSWSTVIKKGNRAADVTLFGALDDCLVGERRLGRVKQEIFIPLDYKTRGSAPRPGDSERYYQTQLDTYTTLLHHNGYETGDQAWLVYYYPLSVKKNGQVKFQVKPVAVPVSVGRLEKMLAEAVEVLLGPSPLKHGLCEFNDWHRLVAEFD